MCGCRVLPTVTYNVLKLGQDGPGKVADQNTQVRRSIADVGNHDHSASSKIVRMLF